MIDAAHRALVNHEAYFFADDATMQLFVAEPYKYTGKVTDPVTLMRFDPNPQSPTRSYSGRLFYFSTEETARTFDTDVAKYGVPKPGMREMMTKG